MSEGYKIRVDQIPYEGKSFDYEVDAEWVQPRLGVGYSHAKSPLRLEGEVMPSGPGFLLKGSLAVKLAFTCGRCAARGSGTTEADFDHVFLPREDGHSDGDEDAIQVTFFEGEQVDLEPMLIEEVVLALPEYPLCRQDCQGLCVTCGINLNHGECECEPEIDPRWEKLRHIKVN